MTTDSPYSQLPPAVRVEDTVAGVATSSPPEPDDVRNAEQHAALRDD